MVIFQIIFIVVLFLEISIGLAIKYNYNGIQDKLVRVFMSIDIEDYIRNKFPDKWIMQTLFLLILFLLAIC